MRLARFRRFGHRSIALIGGGTALVGDPSGKKRERQPLTREEVEANVEAIRVQLVRMLDCEVKGNPVQTMNNADWLMSTSIIDFLVDVGKRFGVSYMIAKDSAKQH